MEVCFSYTIILIEIHHQQLHLTFHLMCTLSGEMTCVSRVPNNLPVNDVQQTHLTFLLLLLIPKISAVRKTLKKLTRAWQLIDISTFLHGIRHQRACLLNFKCHYIITVDLSDMPS